MQNLRQGCKASMGRQQQRPDGQHIMAAIRDTAETYVQENLGIRPAFLGDPRYVRKVKQVTLDCLAVLLGCGDIRMESC